MATTHALSVVKNDCYKAPRLSNSELPATMKETKKQDTFSQHLDVGNENSENTKRTKARRIGSRNRLMQNLYHEQEDGVSKEQFYSNLMQLREEHKKTLKLLETRYYDELKKQSSFQWEGFQQGVGLQEYNGLNGSIASDQEGHILEHSQSTGGNVHSHPKSPVQDSIKDLSHSTHASTGQEYQSSESSDERDFKGEPEEKGSVSAPEDFSSSLFPKRSSAIDMVEHLWKDFSVQDYTAVADETLEAEQTTQKITQEKEWTPTITVPKPFTMTLRDANKEKRKSRSMKLLEKDLVLKKSMEEAELKKKFRAQPIPATTFLPLYDDIIEKNKRRSEHVREINKAILKATEKPFSFVKREEMRKHQKDRERRKLLELKREEEAHRFSFKARPPPKNQNDLTLADRLTEQEEYRKIRKKIRAAELLATSRLPPSMEARANVTPAAKSRKKCRKFRESNPQFRPNINPDVPDFDALHWEFEKELRKRKKERQPTVVEPFHLRTAHIPRAKSSLIRARSMDNIYRNLEESPSNPRTKKNRPYSARLSSSQDTLPFGTTESVRLRDNAVKKSLDVQRQRNETLKARKAQKQRTKQLRSQVCVKAMANDHSWKLKKSNEQKLKTFRESDRDRQEEYERELVAMRRRVEQRPLLFEREAQQNAKRKAEKKYVQTLREAAVNEHLVNSLLTKHNEVVDAEDSDDTVRHFEAHGSVSGDNDDDNEYEYSLSDRAALSESGSEQSEPLREQSDDSYQDD